MFCPKCGINNKNGAAFCAGCGNPLNAQQTGGAAQQKKSGSQPYGQLYTHQPTSGPAQPYGPDGYRNSGGGAQPFGPGGGSATQAQDYLNANIAIAVLSILTCSLIPFIIAGIGVIASTSARKAAASGNPAAAAAVANSARALFFISLAVLFIHIVFGYRKFIIIGKLFSKHFLQGMRI